MKKIDKYIAKYFHKTEKIISSEKPKNIITLQFFQRKDDSLLAGMNEVLELLKNNSDISKYKIRYLPEGSIINSLDIVLELEGHYEDFGKFEGMIDGILSRSSSIATNGYHCKKAAKGKNIIFMGDRADHYLMQKIDGKAIAVAGITSVSTDMHNINHKESTFGSVPHALIQNFGGDTKAAMIAYSKTFPNNKLIALVDYHNNVIKEAVECFNLLKDKLYGVRVDTAKNIKDHMFDNEPDNESFYGVNVEQIKRLRKALDEAGANNVKIIVSSGFNPEKIKFFEDNMAPVDSYGVGQSIFKSICSFSADATLLNGKKEAKEGRFYRKNENLVEYN
ncbi:nicotinate phosphoribosyltransferase [Mycoplasma sp. Mirounga ES2805-ORL]|uniref:nicotinate phosphoribosyltransferase n=1 Tax=Mycoplasma sp. Mirounga ES2805-ORL TaxID=754514 RepID=UPI00197BC2E8|nr:nicotinate phosphoribosyltransferase [Mycoplasma sp. Mirounga ES2805-ORL]QSF13700.1 nicotinate phosphoribosyltransferase [Mycoplasma sp. Mirounga ES2805-ORL]